MQIVSSRDNLHEVLILFSGKNNKKYRQFDVHWISPESGEG